MGELTYGLTDPELGPLERAGVGGLACVLEAARDQGMRLPVSASVGARSLTLRWCGLDEDALVPLVELAWQARGEPGSDSIGESDGAAGPVRPRDRTGLGVLLFPGIHRGSLAERAERRLHENNGVLRTFLQHPKVQPRTRREEAPLQMGETTTVTLAYSRPRGLLRYPQDARRRLFLRGHLRARVCFSSYLYPGATARHHHEDSWAGSGIGAFALMFAPTTAYYVQVASTEWVVVLPEVVDLERFAARRPRAHLGPGRAFAAGAADAGLTVLSSVLEEGAGCIALQLGKVRWNDQRVRTGRWSIPGCRELARRHAQVRRRLANRVARRSDGTGAFVAVPASRERIARNLLHGMPWYAGLFDHPTDEPLRYYAPELLTLMQDLHRPSDVESILVEAIHLSLGVLEQRRREARRPRRRRGKEAPDELTDHLRRRLLDARSRMLLRRVLAEFFATNSPNEVLQRSGREIWAWVDDPRAWRHVRDLALLGVATYRPAAAAPPQVGP